MLVDTGAKVTIVSTAFVQHLSPNRQLPDDGREVRSLAGTRTALRGPVSLTFHTCDLSCSHIIYFCENIRTPLLVYDVISTAGLVIDSESRCVWSKFTANWASTQSFANSADSITPPSCSPSLRLLTPPPLLLFWIVAYRRASPRDRVTIVSSLLHRLVLLTSVTRHLRPPTPHLPPTVTACPQSRPIRPVVLSTF